MNKEVLDPVIEWLNAQGIRDKFLSYEEKYDLGQCIITIRSNAADLMEKIKETFCFYPHPSKKSNFLNPIQIEIYCMGSMTGESGIALDAFLDTDLNHKNNYKIAKDGFVHYAKDNFEYFWRSSDLLISFPEEKNQPIRIIVCDEKIESSNDPESICVKIKGKRKFPDNIHEIMDLIKILLIRRQEKICVHGATIAIDDKGVFITGESGAGKTTTALAAVRDGFRLLSDELTLITTASNGSVRLQGLLIPPSIIGNPPAHLEHLEKTLLVPESKFKNPYFLSESDIRAGLYGSVIPKAVIFLEKTRPSSLKHNLTPISLKDAMEKIMGQVLDFDCSSRLKLRFDAVVSLISGCPTYSLTPGTDLKSLPDIIRTCLQG